MKSKVLEAIMARSAPRWARALVAAGVALMVVSGAAFGVGAYLLHRYTSSVHQQNLLGSAAATQSSNGATVHASIDGPINILMLGIDERETDPTARSDSIIIAHIDGSHSQAYLVSIPRDTRVRIPAYPKTHYAGGIDKINAAFQYGSQNGGGRAGGFELLALTVEQLMNISFNAGAIVNFDGFRSVVDAVGGVDMCVDERTVSVHIGWDENGKETAPYKLVPPDFHAVPIKGVRPQVYDVGCQHFNGWQALDYVRQRELIPDGDYGRERHQQQFLKALAKKTTSSGMVLNPLKLDTVLRSAGDAVTFDGNGVSLADWAFNLKGIGPNAITMIKTNGGQFNTQVIGGQDFEILTPTSLQLFDAVRTDTVGSFLMTQPTWIANDNQP